MSDTMQIQIMGRAYQVSVKPGERASLEAAVEMVNDKLQQLIGKQSSGSESTAVMCALMIAHEAVVAQRTAGLDMPAYQRRIEAMVEQIDKVAGKQENLF
ncbi:cell division protein ZapA [Uliginosibacterium paludis]|uniref:Cell division protein ZapA n=1 Tax=Uliginosibacterium paludis TaxID=1615952 RepID=A0ABV2CWM8_9RHOO